MIKKKDYPLTFIQVIRMEPGITFEDSPGEFVYMADHKFLFAKRKTSKKWFDVEMNNDLFCRAFRKTGNKRLKR